MAQEFTNYLARISYLLIPSRMESIPVVFSDALQMRVPVIAMPVGDLPELIQKYRCGIVSQKANVISFAQAIEEGVESKGGFFTNGTKAASDHFKVPQAIKTWLNQ